jgi:hypothetical protein
MVPEIAIWRAANLLIRRHGAPTQSLKHQNAPT